MESQPDVNKIAAEVILTATERAVSRAASPARNALRRVLQAITDAYQAYLEQTYSRVRTIRTFLKPNEPVDLLSHYVPVTLGIDKKKYKAEDVIEEAVGAGRVVVSGLAGRGKSVLMRYIALSLYHAPRGKIPLIIELRSLNNLTSKNVLQYIHAQYRGRGRIRFADFEEALRKGYPAHFFASERRLQRSSREVDEWNRAMLKALTGMQEQKDPAFRRLPALTNVSRDTDKIWSAKITVGTQYDALLKTAGFDEYVRSIIRALRAVRKDQQTRATGDDDFLKAVFS